MRSSSCTSGFTLGAVKVRNWLILAVLVASVTTLPASAGAARSKHRLQAFGSCSRFVHYARRHAPNELRTRGVPIVGVPTPVRAPTPMTNDNNEVVLPEAAPVAG